MHRYPCHDPSCPRTFRSVHGQTNHYRTFHVNRNLCSQSQLAAGLDPADEPQNEVQDDATFVPYSPSPSPPPPSRLPLRASKTLHPGLNAIPCDQNGQPVDPDLPPPPRTTPDINDWAPYADEVQFKTADFLFRRVEMSAPNIDYLLELWALSLSKHDDTGPFASYEDLYSSIDATRLGDAPWKCFSTSYDGEVGPNDPSWKSAEYEVWYRDPDVVISNMLDNPDFNGQFDYAPYIRRDKNGQRTWSDFMSGNYAWKHADAIIEENEENRGAMYCPIILGSDKTTVSVATGHVEYHPLYLSIGGVYNTVRRAHRNAVVPIGFLAIPKSDRKYDNDVALRKFKRQLYHASLSTILRTLRPGMTTPVVRRCPDGHFRRIIYDLAAYIADYPEQVLLGGTVQNWCPKDTSLPDNLDGPSGRRSQRLTEHLMNTWSSQVLWNNYGIDDDVIPFTFDFPRADIHEMLSPDILHQLIKGTFKDHLVEWVGHYLVLEHGEARAKEILDDIDRRIAAVPAFPQLRRFPHGRRFKQWTGDDSKALMKMSSSMFKIAHSLSSHTARRDDLSEASIKQLEAAIRRFHKSREIFRTTGVRPEGFSLPRQHALSHYPDHIQSRHITAVKKPWRRSNRYEALGQMLLTNQRLDKLAAARADFVARGMLAPDHAAAPLPFAADIIEGGTGDADAAPIDDEYVTGNVVLARTREPAKNYPRALEDLAAAIVQPRLPELMRRFLFDQLNDDETLSSNTVPLNACPVISSEISVYHSATATFYAPSDDSGIRGMRRERIRSTPSWRGRGPRRDCAFVVEDDQQPGMKGMSVVRVQLFFSFKHDGVTYPCALVEWFKTVGRGPDAETGLWKVKPDVEGP
ncbi:hypothetical protein D9615_008783 [Tricholomella constricta]|uniref:C2H2-type domain-containing protein n=1 Tax=Tricholomella constricta TaxID=117010 RepID=A0A8H5M1Z9_9AGAR|nr:hypothetical protein D9615_008783 [Tricholomella constricta]